jgi:hypothetical protein
MAERFRRLELTDVIHNIMSDQRGELVQLNLDQLLGGQAANDQLLTPKFTDDPFFKTRKQALGYAKWKKKLGSKAPFNYPDLFINGYTHARLSAAIEKTTIVFKIDVPWAAELKSKYQDNHLGLNTESHDDYQKMFYKELQEAGKAAVYAMRH